MKTAGIVTLPKAVPQALAISTLLTLTDHGTTGTISNAGAALTNFSSDDAVLYHEGLLKIEVLTVGGKGATPTAVGASDTFTLKYAFTDTLLDAVADAPVILATSASSLVCALPNAISVRPSGTLTLSGLPANAETVTIGNVTYTFRTVVVNPYDVKIGASAAATATNLINAINFSGGTVGTDYGNNAVAHPLVTAATGGSGVVTVTAKAYNTSGNSIATTEVASNTSWGGATLSGGSAAGTAIHSTASFVHLGRYLYTWYDRTAFAADALIDVTAKLIRL